MGRKLMLGRLPKIALLLAGLLIFGLWRWFAGDEPSRNDSALELEPVEPIERIAEGEEKLTFLVSRCNDATEVTPAKYHWSGEDIVTQWSRQVSGNEVLLRSPRLPFSSMEEIESITIKLADAKGTRRLALLWNDRPSLSPIQSLQHRRELVVGHERSKTFLVKGHSISDIEFLGTGAHEKPPRYLFLEFSRDLTDAPVFDAVDIVTKTSLLAGQQYGRTRLAFRGEIREILFLRTPATVAYRTAGLHEGSELSFGLRCLHPAVTARSKIKISTGSQQFTLFDRIVEGTDWQDYRIRLLPLEPDQQIQNEVVITLQAEADRPTAVLWSNPMILRPGQGRKRPNVILYVIDALRARQLGSYGYSKTTSPFLDGLAAKGVLFRHCYSPSSWTKPSIVTLLTSLYPQTHGVGLRSYSDRLPDNVPTLQDHMRQNGYLTASFSANPLSSVLSNLDRGFDYVFTPNSFAISNAAQKQNKIHSDDLNAKILPWLESHRRESFFLYIQSIDPHPPLASNRFNSKQDADPVDLYDAAIRFNDEQIRSLYEKLTELGLAEETLFVVTSDHGEAFGEHARSGHGISLYQEETQVPLILVHPKRLSHRVVDFPANLVDVMPAILKYCSVPFEAEGLQGIDLFDRDGATRQREIFLTRFVYPASFDVEEFKRNEFYAVIQKPWKLIVRDEADREPHFELYNLAADPFEKMNLSSEKREHVGLLYSRLSKFLKWQEQERLKFLQKYVGVFPSHAETEPVPEDLIEQLRSLGYLR